MIEEEKHKRRGSPLTMLGLLAVAWIGGRAMLWESPFAQVPLDLPAASKFLAKSADSSAPSPLRPAADRLNFPDPLQQVSNSTSFANALQYGVESWSASRRAEHTRNENDNPFPVQPQVAAGHQLLWLAALGHLPMPRAVEEAALSGRGQFATGASSGSGDLRAPFFARPDGPAEKGNLDHWSLDGWAFWRQGSNATAISQGRVPIYGASQVGASLRYRIAPQSKRDPLLYTRAYRALVQNGESEVAAGVAAKPIGSIPLRGFAELRYIDNAFGSEVRPAAFVVTELPPQSLPGRLTAEAYGQAGYVGGDASTPFADGQLVMSREVASFDLASTTPARLSVGAGAWGGAQKDATRLDIGPTVRIDLTIGQVPARVSVDWREQVAGDAAPASGVAATLSTRF
ncbi:hypothetical protein [uncultured Erythrobacter sp.]|uniref:hypothetical protein n=1 Tax=uncultured Erythrobacter sp. TaxID=263913 RepID=UPI00263956FA|nr:hypothetical protein [uncultured Erythrobacter sp.]